MEATSGATIRKTENPPGERDFDLRLRKLLLATRHHVCLSAPVKPVAGHRESDTAKPTSSGGTCWRKTGEAAGRWLPPHVRLHVWRERREQALGTAAARDSGKTRHLASQLLGAREGSPEGG